jgi:hypothetical protein
MEIYGDTEKGGYILVGQDEQHRTGLPHLCRGKITSGQRARIKGYIGHFEGLMESILRVVPLVEGPDIMRRNARSGAREGLLAEIVRELGLEEE